MKRNNIHPKSSAVARCVVLICMVAGAGQAADLASTNYAEASEAGPPSMVLTNAQQVHLLSRKEAAATNNVLIRGVVTCALKGIDAAVVQDDTAVGIYVDQWNSKVNAPPELGELVEVAGVTDPGDFAPRVHASRVTRLGVGNLPAPIHPYWDQLSNGSLDTQFVEIEGIVTSVRADGITLVTHEGPLNILIFGEDDNPNAVALMKPYEGAHVRLRGCLFASWNNITHEVDVSAFRMFDPSVTEIEAALADVFSTEPKRVRNLLQFDPQASALRMGKVFGQIVYQLEGEYFAMDGPDGFRFIPRTPEKFEIGDLVEVVGYPNLTGPSPVMEEALARKIKTIESPLPAPRLLNAGTLFRPQNDATIVSVDADLLSLSADRRTMELQSGLRRFTARLDWDSPPGSPQTSGAKGIHLPVGSRLELTGVYSGHGGNRTAQTEVASFEILLNSPGDIQVLERPPLWTLQRLLVLVGALLAVLGLALVWIRLLHHQVQQRSIQLQKEIHVREQAEHQRGVAQERARIARDLHDDLGSSLTEITMLATASPGLKLPPDEAAERMGSIAGKSRDLVYALDEIVWAVDPERDTLASLVRYVASYVEEYLAELKVVCRVQIPNSFPDMTISGEVRHHLYLAVKEIINNAVRHSGASEVSLRVELRENRLWISVADNGRGFDAFKHQDGHGLLNIRARLEQLCGRCDLESAPGAGTTVSLQLPLAVSNHVS